MSENNSLCSVEVLQSRQLLAVSPSRLKKFTFRGELAYCHFVAKAVFLYNLKITVKFRAEIKDFTSTVSWGRYCSISITGSTPPIIRWILKTNFVICLTFKNQEL